MDGLRISEAAAETGFSVSTLRYYEDEGVVVPNRSPNGYRAYTNDHLAALRFVARGKQLGLRLDEITDLLGLLEDDECEPVQTQIRTLVDRRITQTQDRIAELVAFAAQLQQAVAGLDAHTANGGCDDRCGCRADAPVETNDPSGWEAIPLAGPDNPIACSLEPESVGDRIDDWNDVLARAIGRTAVPGGVRVDLGTDVDVASLAQLAAAEQACCDFFRFDIGIDAGGLDLTVTGPEEAQDVIASVFGVAA